MAIHVATKLGQGHSFLPFYGRRYDNEDLWIKHRSGLDTENVVVKWKGVKVLEVQYNPIDIGGVMGGYARIWCQNVEGWMERLRKVHVKANFEEVKFE